MITACVEDLIARGIIKAEDKAFHVTGLLDGNCYIKAMSEAECERWYNAVFDK